MSLETNTELGAERIAAIHRMHRKSHPAEWNPDQGTVARLHFIDWVRVLAFGLLILFHCAMPFVVFGWEIKDTQTSTMASRWILWLHQWRLPLLFFIAGVSSWFSLTRRSWYGFFGERFVRLFVPLWFAMLFTIPLQVYYERLQQGKVTGSYAAFYPSVWTFVPYPEGTLTWSHLWFVVYLFVFTFLLAPVMLILRTEWARRWKMKLDRPAMMPLWMTGPWVLMTLIYFKCYVRWPEQQSLLDDWFVFNSSMWLFFMGFLLAELSCFWRTCEDYRWLFFGLSAGCAAVLFAEYWWDLKLPRKQDTSLYLYGSLNSMHVWAIILATLGFARRHLNAASALLRHATPAVYPFYILHQTVIVSSGYYVVQWPIPAFFKFLVLVVTCFGTVYVLYRFIITKTMVTRVLFGLKPKTGV